MFSGKLVGRRWTEERARRECMEEKRAPARCNCSAGLRRCIWRGGVGGFASRRGLKAVCEREALFNGDGETEERVPREPWGEGGRSGGRRETKSGQRERERRATWLPVHVNVVTRRGKRNTPPFVSLYLLSSPFYSRSVFLFFRPTRTGPTSPLVLSLTSYRGTRPLRLTLPVLSLPLSRVIVRPLVSVSPSTGSPFAFFVVSPS